MPKFAVCVTRDVTESAWIEVEAEDAEEADLLALERARDSDIEYILDDCSGGAPYLGDPGSAERVE